MLSETTTTWWIECGANLPNGLFTRNHIMTTNNVIKFRYKYENKGVFATAYMYDDKDQSKANLYGDFYLDFDYDITDSNNKEEAFNIVRNEVLNSIRYFKIMYGISQESIKIYFSGSKGIHLIVPKEIFGVEPMQHLNMIYRMMAEDVVKFTHSITLDMKIYDNKRLFRLPNSIHPKTGLYKIPLKYDELTSLSYSDITKLASNPKADSKMVPIKVARACLEYKSYITKLNAILNKPRGNSPDVKLDYTPPCVEFLLKNPMGKGQRNETLAFLASFFKQTGMGQDKAETTLLAWNDQMCEPPISEREVTITVQSIYSGQGKVGCAKATILSKCDPNCKFKKKGI
jgi:hypothetical protein